MDILAPAAWVYGILTLFVVDAVGLAARGHPALEIAVQFRFLVVLGLLIALFLLLRRWAWAVIGYFVVYPAIVLIWKVPAFFWRRRSSALVLAGIQAVFIITGDVGFKLLAIWLALLSASIVFFVPPSAATLVAAVGMVAVLTVWLMRSAIRTITTPSFIAFQRSAITRILSSDRTRSLLALDDKYRRGDLERYEPDDAQQVMLRIGAGVALNKALLLWASQLERYRMRYRPNFIFGALSFVWVYTITLFTLAVANFGVHQWDPSQYAIASQPSFLAILLYTFSTMSGTGAGVVAPAGDMAYFIALVGGIYGALAFAYLAANVILVFRQARDDEATQQLVTDLRTRAREHAREFRTEYRVDVDEARRKLEDIGFVFAAYLTRLSALIPEPAEVRASRHRA